MVCDDTSPYLSLQDVLFYKRIDPPLASQANTDSRVRTQIDLGWVFCEGEKVRVESDVSVAIQLQEELVGWNDEMKQVNVRLFYTWFSAPICSYFKEAQLKQEMKKGKD